MARLADVNTTNIAEAIEFGCRTMESVFDADDDYVPFFWSCVWPGEPTLRFGEWASDAHVPGRHLNGLLTAEAVVGVAIDEIAVDRHAEALFFSLSGPVPLPLNRTEKGGDLVNFSPHNLREVMHGLYALARYRQSERAHEMAERVIATMLKRWSPEERWNGSGMDNDFGLVVADTTFVTGEGRLLGPLTKYHRATGSLAAFELATMLKDEALRGFFTAVGDYDPAVFGTHCHSATSVMSSLAQFGELTGDAALLKRVKTFFDRGLWEMRDELGWSKEFSDQGHTDHGEANNTGDILETALILGRNGHLEYLDDAELILRSHLLPSQLRDVSFIEESPPNPPDDARRDIATRQMGSFGFPAPYGHLSTGTGQHGGISFNTDIVGGVVGSLCEAYQAIVRADDRATYVGLLFDLNLDHIEIESPYRQEALTIRMHRSAPLSIRIPLWAAVDEVEPADLDWSQSGQLLQIHEPPVDEPLVIRFPLVERAIELSRNHTKPIRVLLRGDEVVAMESHGAQYTFFGPYEQTPSHQPD